MKSTKTYGFRELRYKCRQVFEQVRRNDEEILILDRGRPYAVVRPLREDELETTAKKDGGNSSVSERLLRLVRMRRIKKARRG